MNKRWVEKDSSEEEVKALQEALQLKSPILPRLFIQRNLRTSDEVKNFLNPSLEDLHDPFIMKDMHQAVERIENAILNQEKIMIYGDYDVDGTTSVSLVYLFLSQLYNNIEYYIPNRYKEGYGISIRGLDYANQQGVKLIIALDCGIKAIDKVEYAKGLGIDMIICDHHLPGDKIPNAVAVLDPKVPGCEYPYKELSGAAIGFKLCQAFASTKGISKEQLYPFLDLVVVSLAADIVPLTGENRILSYFGLKQLTENPRPGLKSLIQLSGVKGRVTISDIVFKIGPRINAAGRMEDATDAVKLLIGTANHDNRANAAVLQQHNDVRKDLDRDITEQALEMLRQEPGDNYSSVLHSQDWHKGVIGIVASRLIEQYYRPAVVLTGSGDSVSGSARSVRGFDLYEAIEACSDLLHQFGGHKYAAGLTMSEENVPAFKERFEAIAREKITEEMRTPIIEYDVNLPLAHANYGLINKILRFEPFGPGNPKPIFLTQDMKTACPPRVVGQTHLKVAFKQGFTRLNAIGFGLGEWASDLDFKQIDALYTLEENEWNNQKSLQMSLKDLKFSSQ